MAGLVLLALILLPVIEIAVLVWIGVHTSLFFVLSLVIGMGLFGAILLRYQSWQTLRRVSKEMEAGRMPAEPLVDGMFVLVAAVLLILPGLLSDVAAILLLLPPTRALCKAALRRRVQARVVRTFPTQDDANPRERIIDVRVIDTRPNEP